ncbi:protein of unknown function [Eubacterium ruminantium]|nr:protein of unknown function [Eubacterium ruminantium]
MSKKLFAAIDVGTTTVAVSLLDEDFLILRKDGFLNPESKYGSDIISRITNSEKEDNLLKMQGMIISAIDKCLCKMLVDDLSAEDVICGIISANTTMASILLGLDLKSLGEAPFVSPFSENTGICLPSGIKCFVLAGASAFIGGDAVAGAYYKFQQYDKKLNLLLMDLGTNGEMILRKGGELYSISAACGPAFENSTRAVGVYGKTTLSAIAFLLKKGELSRTLKLTDDFVQNGRDVTIGGVKLHLTEKIIRNIQLAVAAIYSSVIFVLDKAGLDKNEVDKVFISGGFGFYMSLSDAVTIGLIPECFMDKTEISGNTSLLGAEYLLSNCFDLDNNSLGFEEYDEFRKNIKLVQPGGDVNYEKLYVSSMTFEKR